MPFGVLFISLHFTWWDILLLSLAALAVLALNLAAVVLPFAAIWALFRRRLRWAMILAVIAVPVSGWSFWPILRDYLDFRRTAAGVEALQVTKAVPDLTGKVVALLVDDERLDGIILECHDLLHHSGAAKVYLLRRRGSYPEIDDAPDWRGTVDLTHWVVGEAVARPLEGVTPDRPPDCGLGPTESGLQPIDYFIARNIALYTDDAPQGFTPDPALGARPRYLDEYFAPVADRHRFRIAPGNADLVRVPLWMMGEGFPRLLGEISWSWPSSERDIRDYRDPVRAALCRYTTDSCVNY